MCVNSSVAHLGFGLIYCAVRKEGPEQIGERDWLFCFAWTSILGWFGLVIFFFFPLGVQQGFHMQERQELLVSKLIVLPHYLD